MRLERKVDEARSGDVYFGDEIVGAEPLGDFLSQLARLLAGVLGERHRGIGRHIAVGRIARRLDHDAGEVGVRAKQRSGRRAHASEHGGEEVQGYARGDRR
jgi:hypothetical protein